jgi:hypothetical protein
MKTQTIDLHQQRFVNAVAAIIVKQSQKAKQAKSEKLAPSKKVA